MAKVLLINPSYQQQYGGNKTSVINPIYPTLGLATIAATAEQSGHEVEILDLSWRPYDYELVKKTIERLGADIVVKHKVVAILMIIRGLKNVL